MKRIIAIATTLAVSVMIAGPVGAITVEELQAEIARLTALAAQLQAQLATLEGTTVPTTVSGAPSACSGITFSKNLSQGMSGSDVKCLQALLNQSTDTQVATTGVGSLGNETSYFGPLTKAAVIKFQEKYASEVLAFWGLTQGTGYVGSTTRAKLNALLVAAPVTPPVTPPAGCECTSWANVACAGACLASQMQQSRTCTPSGCAIESQCVADSTCAVTPPAVVGTLLTVGLASDTPATTVVASSTAFNKAVKLSLTAGADGQVKVTSIKFTKTGISANTYVSGVDLIDADGARHGNVISSITAENTVTIVMTSNPLVIPAGTTKTATLRFNTASTATSGTIQFGVAAAADVVTDGALLSGSFPIWGNSMSLADGSSVIGSAVLDIQAVNASGATLSVNTEASQDIAKFSIQQANSNEDIKVESLTLYNNGTAADTDYKDVELVAPDGTSLVTVQPSSKNVVLDISSKPYTIQKGITRNFTIRAKIISGTSRTIQFVVYNDYDAVIKGISTGAYILASTTTGGSAGTGTSFPVGNKTDYNKVIIGSGTVTFSKASDSPSAGVAPGAQSAVIAKYNIKGSGEDMELRKLTLVVSKHTAGTAPAGSIQVKYNGAAIWSGAVTTTNVQAEYTGGGTVATLTLSSYPTMTANVNGVLEVVMNVSSSAVATDHYTAYLDVTEVKRVVTNDLWDPEVNQTAGNQVTVKVGALTIKTLTIPVSTSVVQGTTGFELARVDLDATDSGEDVRVSSIKVTDTKVGTGASFADINNLLLYVSGSTTPLATSTSTSSLDSTLGTVTFTFTTPIAVTKNSVIHLILKGDIASKGAAVGVTETHRIRVASADDVNTTGADTGNTIGETVSGNGQAMTIADAGALAVTSYSKTGVTPNENQLAKIGTSGGVYFAFKLNAAYEDQKITSLMLTATGSNLNATDLLSAGLYADDNDMPATSPFATFSQFDTDMTKTLTASDNLLPSAVKIGSPMKVWVKADIGPENIARLGDDFVIKIADPSNDIVAKGAYTGGTSSVTPATAVSASGTTYISPFSVKVEGVNPTAGSTVEQTVTTSTAIARFKVSNLGSAPITLTDVKFTNNGSDSSSLETYDLYASSDGGVDYVNTIMENEKVNSVDFGTVTTSVAINAGSSRYLSVLIGAVTTNLAAGNSWNLSVASLGDLKYTVSETNLGYIANGDTDTDDDITGLYVEGKPVVGTITKK